MAEEKVMNSISYYEREHKRIDPRPDNTYYVNGFYQESELKSKDKTRNAPNYADNSLQDESQATSDHGWIAPYDFYKENVHTTNPSTNVNNGFIQTEDETANSVFKFKDQYWWCEDLHNWCVYTTDCVNNPYLNSFYLNVWNGLDNWVPATYSFSADKTAKFSPLQNKIIQKKIDRGECIVMHRGALKNTPSEWKFSNGPLVINHAWILKKSETYSVNSENGFQAIRWSTPKHIVNNSEYSEADKLMRVTAGGLTFKVDIKVRKAFADTNSMWKMFAEDKKSTDKTTPHNLAFYSKHQMNACDYKTSYRCTFEYPVCENGGTGDGSVTWIEESQCNAYNHFGRTLYWRTDSSGITNKAIDDDFKKKYGDENVKSPLNFRVCKYNHLLMNSMAMEKIFAVHIYMVGTDGDVLLPNIWINKNAPEEDRRSYSGGTSYPIYMSYVDICMLFFNGSIVSDWNMPGNKDEGDRSVPFTKDGVWKIKNYPMVITLLSMLQRADQDPENVNKFFDMDYSKAQKWLAKTVDTLNTTASYFTVLYRPKEPDSDGTNYVMRYEFYRPITQKDQDQATYIARYVADNFDNENLGTVAGVAVDVLCPIWGAVDLLTYAFSDDKKSKIPEQLANCARMTFIKKDDNTLELNTVNDYTLYIDHADRNTNDSGYKQMGLIVEKMLNSLTGSQRIEYIDSMITWPGYKEYFAISDALFEPSTSNLREGLSISAPPVYRLPTGDIALCSQLHWAGENRLLGGPGDSNLDNPAEDSVDKANRFINSQCRLYFGAGNNKTIDDHWLKEYKTEADISSKDFGLVENQSLQTGYVFEQINNNNTEKLKMTVTTFRPIVITTISGENVDTAKKW